MANPPHRNASLKEKWGAGREGRREERKERDLRLSCNIQYWMTKELSSLFFLKINIVYLQEVFNIAISFQCFLVILHVKNFLIY